MRRLLALLPLLLLLACRPAGDGELIFLQVGQGDCAIVRSGDQVILIDSGPSERSAARLILPALRRLRISAIDAVIITHADEDHVGGLARLDESVEIGAVIASHHQQGDPKMLETITSFVNRIAWVQSGDVIELPTGEIEFWARPGVTQNAGSLACRIRLGQGTAVLTADLGQKEEQTLAEQEDWDVQVLGGLHHGSNGSLGPEWLAETTPEAVVFSAGRGSIFGHPHPEAVNRAEQARARVFSTARDGHVRFLARPQGFVHAPFPSDRGLW